MKIMKRLLIVVFVLISSCGWGWGSGSANLNGGEFKVPELFVINNTSDNQVNGAATFTTVILDTNSKYDGTASYTIPFSNFYTLSYCFFLKNGTPAGNSIRFMKNGVSITQAFTPATTNNATLFHSFRKIWLVAGDVISIYFENTGIRWSGTASPITFTNFMSIRME